MLSPSIEPHKSSTFATPLLDLIALQMFSGVSAGRPCLTADAIFLLQIALYWSGVDLPENLEIKILLVKKPITLVILIVIYTLTRFTKFQALDFQAFNSSSSSFPKPPDSFFRFVTTKKGWKFVSLFDLSKVSY